MALYKKREMEEFKLLVAEAAFFSENKLQTTFSKNFPPELAATLGGIGAGAVGVAAVFAAFAGMSGAQIMGALAGFGVAGAVGGIVSVAAVVAAPVVLVAGGLWTAANQNKLKNELKRLVDKSCVFEKQLSNDKRENARDLVGAMQAYRKRLQADHKGLR
jgi:hypothetical protein